MIIDKNHQTLNVLYKFMTIVALLLGFGLVFIYSASAVFACEQFGSAHYYLIRQTIALFVGLALCIFWALVPLVRYKKATSILFFLALILTALTLIPGIGVSCHGARRWLLGTSVQPGELLKFSLFLYVSYFIDKQYYNLSSWKKTLLPLLCILGISIFILLCQPDFGSSVTISTTIFALCFVAHVCQRQLLTTLLLSIPLGILLIMLKSYRLQRIFTYLDPWSDPQGRGYQIIQSLIAIGSGGILGRGISYSKQKFFYLPMQHTDFIFSIIAEEMGLVGSLTLVLLYVFFVKYGFELASLSQSPFTQSLIFCCVFFIGLQAFMNCMVATGMIPTKGLALPFVSYGGSVLISSLSMVGCIINCVLHDYNLKKKSAFSQTPSLL